MKSHLLIVASLVAATLGGVGCKGSEAKADGPFKITQFGLQIDLPQTSKLFGAASATSVAIQNSNIGILDINKEKLKADYDYLGYYKDHVAEEKCTDFKSETLPNGFSAVYGCETPYGKRFTGVVGYKTADAYYSCQLSSSPDNAAEAVRVIEMCKTLRPL